MEQSEQTPLLTGHAHWAGPATEHSEQDFSLKSRLFSPVETINHNCENKLSNHRGRIKTIFTTLLRHPTTHFFSISFLLATWKCKLIGCEFQDILSCFFKMSSHHYHLKRRKQWAKEKQSWMVGWDSKRGDFVVSARNTKNVHEKLSKIISMAPWWLAAL